MAHPRSVQSILPQSLHNVDKLKALCKRILKLYIRHRMETEWTTYTGRAKNIFKSVTTKNASDPWRILKDCDTIKKEIENLKSYSDMFSLVEKLNTMTLEAVQEEWRVLSNPSLRGPTYFAIISLLNEMMKIQFPAEYADDVSQTKQLLEKYKAAYNLRCDDGMDPDKEYAEINATLTKLVLLGAREVFSEAFYKDRNLFPQFKRISSTSTHFVPQSDIDLFRQWVKTQYLTEPGRGAGLTKLDLPNMNVPYPLQPNFAMIYLKNEPDRQNKKTFDEGLEYCANLAIRDKIIGPDRSFYTQYGVDPKSFDAKNDPSDATEIIADDESHRTQDYSDIDENDLEQQQYESDQQAEGSIAATDQSPASSHVDEESLAQSNSNNADASNVVPFTPPASPKVSQMGAFAASPTTARTASPVQEVEEAASLEADGDTQEEASSENGSTQTKEVQSTRSRRRK